MPTAAGWAIGVVGLGSLRFLQDPDVGWLSRSPNRKDMMGTKDREASVHENLSSSLSGFTEVQSNCWNTEATEATETHG